MRHRRFHSVANKGSSSCQSLLPLFPPTAGPAHYRTYSIKGRRQQLEAHCPPLDSPLLLLLLGHRTHRDLRLPPETRQRPPPAARCPLPAARCAVLSLHPLPSPVPSAWRRLLLSTPPLQPTSSQVPRFAASAAQGLLTPDLSLTTASLFSLQQL